MGRGAGIAKDLNVPYRKKVELLNKSELWHIVQEGLTSLEVVTKKTDTCALTHGP